MQIICEEDDVPPTHFEQVQEFQRKFQLPCSTTPVIPPAALQSSNGYSAVGMIQEAEEHLKDSREAHDELWGRVQMMLEELREFAEAIYNLREANTVDDRVHALTIMADSLVDLEYFTLGTAAMMGLPHDEIFEAVHEANMQKVLVESAEESKRLNKLDVKKPEGWTPPDVLAILQRHCHHAVRVTTGTCVRCGKVLVTDDEAAAAV